jgi:hypothetical protein
MPSTGLNGRPILILSEDEAKILTCWIAIDSLKSQELRDKIFEFVKEAAVAETQPTFAELMNQPTELQRLMSRSSQNPDTPKTVSES